MGLFNDHRVAGLSLIIVGVLSLLFPLLFSISLLAMMSEWGDIKGFVISTFGFTIAGFIELYDGIKIYRSKEGRLHIICEYLLIAAVIILIDVFTDIISIGVEGENPFEEGLISMILAMISVAMSITMVLSVRSGHHERFGKIIWCFTVVIFAYAFIRMIYTFIIELDDVFIFEVIDLICMILVYMFMFLSLSTVEIREKMGFNVSVNDHKI